MARRRKVKRSRSRNRNVNLLKLAEAAVIGGIMTRNMAGTSLRNFLTNENPTDGVTFMELLRGSTASTVRTTYASGSWSDAQVAGMSAGGNLDVIIKNTQANAMPLIIGMISVPIFFKFGKRFARPVLTPIRGLLRNSGVTV